MSRAPACGGGGGDICQVTARRLNRKVLYDSLSRKQVVYGRESRGTRNHEMS
jgi:hypothetical protein